MAEGYDTCYIDNYIIGINTLLDYSQIELHPNPAYDLINLKIPHKTQNINVSILNSVGKLVKQINHINPSESIEIRIDDLVAGIYFIRIKQLNYSSKFIKY